MRKPTTPVTSRIGRRLNPDSTRGAARGGGGVIFGRERRSETPGRGRVPKKGAGRDLSVFTDVSLGAYASASLSALGGVAMKASSDVSADELLAQVNADLSKMQLQTTVQVGKHAMAVRLSLFLLIRVLLKILDRDGDSQTRGKVQQALHYCQKKNKEGDPAFRSLAMSIQKLVRTVVGEKRWRQAEMACVVVMSKKKAPVKPQTLLKQRSGSKLGIPRNRPATAAMAAPMQTAATKSASTSSIPAERPLASPALTQQSSPKSDTGATMPPRPIKMPVHPGSTGTLPPRAPAVSPQPKSAVIMTPRAPPKTSPQPALGGSAGTVPPRAPKNGLATKRPASQHLRSQSASLVAAGDGVEPSSQKRQQEQQPARHVRIKSTPTVVGFFGAIPTSQQQRRPGGASSATFASVAASAPRIPAATQHALGARPQIPMASTRVPVGKVTKGAKAHPSRTPPMPAALAATLAAAMDGRPPPPRSPVAATAASTTATPPKPTAQANSTRLPTVQGSPPSPENAKAPAASRPGES